MFRDESAIGQSPGNRKRPINFISGQLIRRRNSIFSSANLFNELDIVLSEISEDCITALKRFLKYFAKWISLFGGGKKIIIKFCRCKVIMGSRVRSKALYFLLL